MDERLRNQRKASGIPGDVVAGVRNALAETDKTPAIVLFSGGGDSTALLLAMSGILGSERISALHLNYHLRGSDSDADEAFCRDFCARHSIDLTVVQAPEGFADDGNLQDAARELRYAAAEELAGRIGDNAAICVAHTADDQAETVLYRLFASPGRRALAGIPERRGRIVRPLLKVRRAQLRDWLEQEGEAWREDVSNSDPRYARVRARQLLADAESLHPAAVQNLLKTTELLAEESAALDAVVEALLLDSVDADGALDLDALAQMAPALGALVLRAYVEREAGRPVPAAAHVLPDALRLAEANGPRELQVEGASIAIHGPRARVPKLTRT